MQDAARTDLTSRQWKAIATRAEHEDDAVLAVTALTNALAMDGRDEATVVKLFRLLRADGHVARALAVAEKAFDGGMVSSRLTSIYILADFTGYQLADCLPDVEAKLRIYRHHPAVHGRAAVCHAWHGDIDRALTHARIAIRQAQGADMADMIRLLLARRLYQLNHREAADGVCRMGRRTADDKADILYDRLLIRTGNAANDGTTHRLFAQLLALEGFPRRTELVAQHVDFLWRLTGPAVTLLDEIDAHFASAPTQDVTSLLLMKLAMAMQLGDDALALRILRAQPALTRKASACLPVARLLRDHGYGDGTAVDRDVEAYATLYDELADSETVLRQRLGDPHVSCAVVGNSACEIGRGNGPTIDAHEEVVRFNRFDTSPPYDRDYGRKTSILVRVGNDKPEIGVDLPPGTLVLISSGSILYRGRAWRAALRMRQEGHRLCVFPQRFHTQLSKMVVGSPSSGLSFVHLLKSLRGTLRREDFFGFAFVDQIGEQPKSAHYFEAARPSFVHKWDKELEIFNSLFADGVPCA